MLFKVHLGFYRKQFGTYSDKQSKRLRKFESTYQINRGPANIVSDPEHILSREYRLLTKSFGCEEPLAAFAGSSKSCSLDIDAVLGFWF